MRVVVAFVVVALLIVGGWYWMNRPTQVIVAANAVAKPAAIAPVEANPDVSVPPSEPASPPAEKKQQKWKSVYHCEIEGKFVYTDSPCKGNGSKVTVMHDTAGVTLAESADVRKYREEHPADGARSAPLPIRDDPTRVVENRKECEKWTKRIKDLDKSASQTPPPAVMQHIREQRTAIQKAMQELDCAHA